MSKRDIWEPIRSIELRYFHSLQGITKMLQKAIEGKTDPYFIIKILTDPAVSKALSKFSQETAKNMITHLLAANARSWREAAREGGKGKIIYEALRQEMQGPIGGFVNQQIQQNAKLIRTLPDDIARRLTKYIQEESLRGRRASDIARDIQKMFPESSRAKAQLIARTEVSKASTALTRARAENIGLHWYEWRTSEDSRVRSSHAHMDRVLVQWSDPPSPESLIGKKSEGKYHAGDIYNCFPGSVDVNLSNGCHKLWRRFYSGSTVIFGLSDSTSLQATPNHPILTNKGWLPANGIQKGDYIIQSLSNRSHIHEQDNNRFITRFDNLFNALTRFCGTGTRMGSELDFHGDGSKHDVDVINTDGLLTDYLMSDFFQGFPNFYLSGADLDDRLMIFGRNSFFSEPFNGVFTTHGTIGLRNIFFAFLDRKLGHAHTISLGTTATRNKIIMQDFADSTAAAIKSGSQSQFAFTSNVPADYFILWEAILPRIMKIFGQNNTPSAESLGQSISFTPSNFSGIFQCGTFFYKLCKVVDLSVSKFIGHVYNLQNDSSWYSVTQNDLVVHNCRCYPAPLTSIERVSWPHKVYYDNKIISMTRTKFEQISK